MSVQAPVAFDFENLRGRSNLDQTPVGVSGQWTLEKLLALTQDEGLSLFGHLPAVPMEELNGHYTCFIPRANDPELQKSLAPIYDENSDLPYHGYWLGKGFRPLTKTTGEGYNRFRLPDGKIERRIRFRTFMGDSLIDGKPSYLLEYASIYPDSTVCKDNTTVDEFRKLENSLYLAAGTTVDKPDFYSSPDSAINEGDGKRSEPTFFMLIGPTDAYLGPTRED